MKNEVKFGEMNFNRINTCSFGKIPNFLFYKTGIEKLKIM
jgi:hypothetical protein